MPSYTKKPSIKKLSKKKLSLKKKHQERINKFLKSRKKTRGLKFKKNRTLKSILKDVIMKEKKRVSFGINKEFGYSKHKSKNTKVKRLK